MPRNPDWVRDELILALDLYIRADGPHLQAHHPEVVRSPDRLLYSNLPIAPIVTVYGPGTVGYMDWNCQCDSYVEGGRPPFTYQWSGALSGTQSYISGTLTQSGHLNLDVWDSEGRHGMGGIWINYDPNVGYYCGV